MTRGYVALHFSFDSRTDKVSCTAKKDMVIQGENGASVALKAGEKFYAVRAANTDENKWYIVRDGIGEKKCSCPAIKPCIHEAHIATGKPLAELRAEVEARAKARKASHKPVTPKATEQDDNMTVQVATPVAVEVYRMTDSVYEKLKATAKPTVKLEEPKQPIRAKSSDIGQRGNLNNASQTTQMPEWLAILPSRQQVVTV